ncbi:MAG: lyase family protein, partial [Vulcanimicrobiaceae bacterium]
VPAGEAQALASRLPLQFDLDAAREAALRGNPVAGIVEQLYAVTPYALYGITSNDLWDMAHVLQLRRAVSKIFDDVRTLVRRLAEIAELHAETPLLARTHGRAGPPTTFGFKVALWLDELVRITLRVQASLRSAALVSIAGSAGTGSSFAVLGIKPDDVERLLATALDLGISETPWVTSRDRWVDLASSLSALATVLGKVGHEVYNLERTGIGELDEAGGLGSMATPHKESNPWVPQRMHGLASIARQLAAVVASGAALPEGEREVGTSYAEWYGLSQLCCVTARICVDGIDVLSRITVDTAAMLANLERDPSVHAESLSMMLARRIGKQRAHELMHDAIRRYRSGAPFAESIHQAFREAKTDEPDLNRAIPGEFGYAVTRTREVVARARDWLASPN